MSVRKNGENEKNNIPCDAKVCTQKGGFQSRQRIGQEKVGQLWLKKRTVNFQTSSTQVRHKKMPALLQYNWLSTG
jgi:hypothetical protein